MDALSVTKKLEQLKGLSEKIQDLASNVMVTDKKEEQYVRNTRLGIFSDKVTVDIDFTDGTIVQCKVSVVRNTFVDDCQ